MGLLTVAETGPALVNYRPAGATNAVVSDAEMFAGFGAGSLPLTVAVLVMVLAVGGAVALMVIVALAPEARLPTVFFLMIRRPPRSTRFPYATLLGSPAGRVSVTATPVAGVGPLLVVTML